MKRVTHKHAKHINKRLRFRLRIYFIISLLLTGIVLYEISTNKVSLFLACIGFIVGLLIGMAAARMFHLRWDNDAKQVISRLDMFGGVILVLYLLLSIFRNTIIGQFVPHSAVTGMSLAVVTGVMFGRVLGTGRKIMTILKEQGILS